MKEQSTTDKRFTLGTDSSGKSFIYDNDMCEYIGTFAGAVEVMNDLMDEISLGDIAYADLEAKIMDEDLCGVAEEWYQELAKEVALLSDEVERLAKSRCLPINDEVPF